MVYIITNAVAALGVAFYIVIGLWIEKWTWRKISIKHIAIASLLSAISVILTNLVSYNLKFLPGGLSLALGDWILFLVGMMFGPLLGITTAICTDSLGSIVNLGGVYHFGFTLDKCTLAFLGSLVFIFKKNNLILLKVTLFYALGLFLESFLFNPVWLYASGYSYFVFVSMVIKLIKFPIEVVLYVFFVYSCWLILKKVIIHWQAQNQVWCLRHENYLIVKSNYDEAKLGNRRIDNYE